MTFIRLTIKSSLLLLLISCSNIDNKEDRLSQLNRIVTDIYDIKVSFNKILKIDDYGCPSCNLKFVEFVEQKLNDSILLIISANGQRFPINQFSAKKKNIIIDRKDNLEKSGILKTSGFIIIENNKIDTTVTISTPAQLKEKLDYINSRL